MSEKTEDREEQAPRPWRVGRGQEALSPAAGGWPRLPEGRRGGQEEWGAGPGDVGREASGHRPVKGGGAVAQRGPAVHRRSREATHGPAYAGPLAHGGCRGRGPCQGAVPARGPQLRLGEGPGLGWQGQRWPAAERGAASASNTETEQP